MTPLERAARALCALDGNPENAKMDGKPLWQDYLPEARAVIEAIREPSETMVDAWMDADLELPEGISHEAPSSVVDPYRARSDWIAMIDAMLSEES